eukprot:TRINITY_DN2383_c0_g1_i1.p1 TRINITY_DN2383_c0_g1~~TRINITY_DN2383_c0_g1_i1.p1  ORF type:complete len:681 (-),score=135.36 TRINITY_DN2383_c0_g1_i1:1648-3690(-)
MCGLCGARAWSAVQNLLLSSKDKDAALKIADFGFARALLPSQGLAETLCGSPLYMAPEILQYQKYDAKADLWSVGAILYELVTGRPPYGGQNHVQLLRNIERSDVVFPPAIALDLSDPCIAMCKSLLRRNPVERLSFEEFFHHPFLDLQRIEPIPGCLPSAMHSTSAPSETAKEDSDSLLLFAFDRQSSMTGPERRSTSTGFGSPILFIENRVALDTEAGPSEKGHRSPSSGAKGQAGHAHYRNVSDITDAAMGGEAPDGRRNGRGWGRPAGEALRSLEGYETGAGGSAKGRHPSSEAVLGVDMIAREGGSSSREDGGTRDGMVGDSFDCIEKEYVVVDAPLRMSSEVVIPQLPAVPARIWGRSQATVPMRGSGNGSPAASGGTNSSGTTRGPSQTAMMTNRSATGTDSMGSRGSIPSSHGSSSGAEGVPGPPSSDPATRLGSLQRSARAITILAADKCEGQMTLEAFSLQLLCLAICRESLGVCHAWAAAASEGIAGAIDSQGGGASPAAASSGGGGGGHGPAAMSMGASEVPGSPNSGPPEAGGLDQEAAAAAACATVEREFLQAVEKAEEISRRVNQQEKMPDGLELVFQSALAVGRAAAVEELMGNVTSAAGGYSRAAVLFAFLLGEAPYLPLSPPFIPNATDRQRLRRYFDSVTQRRSHMLQFQRASGAQPALSA